MGLLDDAIREHLEIKRLRGADPSEVAREEHEALGPVYRGQDTAAEASGEHAEVAAPHAERSAAPPENLPPAPESLAHHIGQETAELDMRTVLKAEHPNASESTGDSLEWEMPSKSPEAAHQTADGEPSDKPTADSGGDMEDVLEETPDFLRETPDQERLWFEQQPPRDFDFDK